MNYGMEVQKDATHRPLISSVGKSPRPQGCSVAPTIKPNRNPNTTEITIPVPKAMKPLFWKRFDR